MDQGSPKKLGDNFEKIRTKLIAKIETQNPETWNLGLFFYFPKGILWLYIFIFLDFYIFILNVRTLYEQGTYILSCQLVPAGRLDAGIQYFNIIFTHFFSKKEKAAG